MATSSQVKSCGLRNVPILYKAYLAMGLMVLLFISCFGHVLSQMGDVNRLYTHVVQKDAPASLWMARANTSLLDVGRLTYMVVTESDEVIKKTIQKDLDGSIEDFFKRLGSAAEKSESVKAESGKIKANFDQIIQIQNEVLSFDDKGDDAQAIKLLRQKFRPSMDDLRLSIRKVFLNEMKDLDAASKNAGERFESTASTTTILAVVGLLFCLALAYFIMERGILAPLLRLTRAMECLAEKNGSCEVCDTNRSDEIGGMARALLVFKENAGKVDQMTIDRENTARTQEKERRQARMNLLRNLVSVGIESGEAVILLGRMKQSVDIASEQAQTMASAIEEMVTSVKQISEGTQTVSGDAQNAERSTIMGLESSLRSIKSIEQITKTADQAAQDVQALAADSSQIGEIVSQIEGIASQTNLLALNATIEAARAGEMGKGFAVVASEVKGLATQTSRATDDIQRRIESLRTRMGGIVQSMGTSVAAVAEGREIITSLGQQLDEISTRIKGVSSHMAEIAAILAEQTSAANDVAKGTNAIAEESKNNTTGIFDILKLMDRLSQTVLSQIGTFADMGPRAIVEIAKTDHIIFKKSVADSLIGRNELKAENLADHHTCRLGKWYDTIQDPNVRNDPAFKALMAPHERVHIEGKKALLSHAQGNLNDAAEDLKRLGVASAEVLDLLDKIAKGIDEREKA